MILPDLPEPQNKEQASIFAKNYATAIKKSHQMKQLKMRRFECEEKYAPKWFVRMVDIEINFILYRIDYLEGWDRKPDSHTYATETLRHIRVALDMMCSFLKPERMYFNSISRAEKWLELKDHPVKADTPKQVKLSRLYKGGHFKGYALSVDGMLLSNQHQVVIETHSRDIHPTLNVTFTVSDEMAGEVVDIHI
ncbi:hypothetical protein XBKQ1_480010 [Xenorhabdus bovienii str. kraussei Quebec]|uniref:Uncharacterized protein n=2 Tax=Xenorhabdus bovienii TaxID=40576 RepID=A0A077PKC6_XENBV|nr:hypothetical protein [Xenorhabdus bovienii]CDH21498.1 hypothetical protein XBKQ1_480010 [Xenorhabdus bovienii str. kraussei Quebec]